MYELSRLVLDIVNFEMLRGLVPASVVMWLIMVFLQITYVAKALAPATAKARTRPSVEPQPRVR